MSYYYSNLNYILHNLDLY